MTSEVLEVAERCEKATGPDRELDADIYSALGYFTIRAREHASAPCWQYYGSGSFGEQRARASMCRLTASLDAAMTLVPQGWWWRLGKDTDFSWASMEPWGCAPDDPRHSEVANCRSPALALCAAALRAIATTSTENG